MRQLMERVGNVPRTCVWEITRACNLACEHCGSAAGRPREEELSTAECVELIGQLAALGNEVTTLSGGEPTLRSDWPAIARAGIEAGVLVNMVTNGQGDPFALAAQSLDVGLANVAVSVDGLEETHDRLRKKGALRKATESIRVLAEKGVWVDAMVTVNRRNLGELKAVYDTVAALGARRFRVQLAKPMGNLTGRDDLTLEPRHLLTLMPTLAKLAKAPGPSVVLGDSVGYYGPHDEVLRGTGSSKSCWTGCYAGVQAIGIQSDGAIKGCLSLQPRAGEEDPFIEGFFRETGSLAEIWNRADAFAYNRGFSIDGLTGSCRGCSYGEVCRGGATCAAYAFTGQLGSDPMCFHAAALATAGARKRAWAKSAAAAATAMLLSFGGGCVTSEPDYGAPVPDTGPEEDGGAQDATTDSASDGAADATGDTTSGDSGADAAPNCDEVNCASGADAVGAETYRACCCEGVCCECDYGPPPPPECC